MIYFVQTIAKGQAEPNEPSRHLGYSLNPMFPVQTLTVLLLSWFLLAGAAMADSLPVGATEIEGQKIPALLEAQNDLIRLYAFREGVPVAIPFQVDERDPKGKWVTPNGQAHRKDENPGFLDNNDVIVFLNRDLGPRGDHSLLPSHARQWSEVRIEGPDDVLGFTYIGLFDEPPPLSDRDDVSYDPEIDMVTATNYQSLFGAPLPQTLILSGQEENILHGLRVRGEARFFGGLFKLRRTEKDISAKIEGWIDGPIRVIRPTKYKISLPIGLKATARVNLIFYRDHVVGHAVARVVIPPRLVPADGELTAHFNFLETEGAHLIADGHKTHAAVDGVMSREEKTMAAQQSKWAALELPDGRTILLTVRLEKSLQTLTQHLYYKDANRRLSFGFKLAGVSRIDTGNHDLAVSITIAKTREMKDLIRDATLLRQLPEVHVATLSDSVQKSAK